ncbi:hypothetical protein Ndes2437B_g05787 [Nannochloris sp. 'desiccata']
MRTSTFFVFADLLLISTTQLPGVFGGCNVRLVQSATADAQTQAVNAITSAFAACTKCPCNVRVTSEAKVVAEASAGAFMKESKEKRAGNCDSVTAVAEGSAYGDVAGDLSTAISEAISKACGGNIASSEADIISSGLSSAAGKAEAATAQGGGTTDTSAESEITGSLEGVLADSISRAVAKCKCGKGRSGGAGSASGQNGDGGSGGSTSSENCPPGHQRQADITGSYAALQVNIAIMRAIIAAWLFFATLTAAQLPTEIAPVADTIALAAPTPAAAPEWAPVFRNGTCAFVYTSPRFYRVKAEITLQGVRTDDVLLNDSLIRVLRAQLNLSPCQVGMSQGTNCTSGTQQLPCSDPVFNCGQGLVISQDIYNAAINGDCVTQTANNTLVCNTIAANPAISSAVSAGSCRPACLSGSAQATQEFPVACTSYLVSIDAPDKAAALVAAASLGNTTLQNAVSSSLSSYSNGLGLQFLVVNSGVEPAVGYGFFPPPPPPMVPIETPSPKPINSTAVALAATGTLVYGPWSSCTPSCGDGYSTRTASCFAPDGTLLPLQACPGGIGTETYQQCSKSCPEALYEYSPWSPCNTTCGGGISTRKATCMAPAGEECADQPEPTTLICNTAPCSSYFWAMSAWSACSASCGGGNRTRTVICVDSSGLQAGTCAAGACACRDGYTGLFCEIPGSCASGVIDSKLTCCPSGLINVRGECCPGGERLDADGECCSQSIDVCGVCGGNGTFVDMQGSCCTVADANGVCCPSGFIDECGVCDGAGNSCAIQLAAQVDVPANLIQSGGVLDAPLTQFFQGAVGGMGIPPESVTVTNVTTGPPTVTAGRRRRNLLQGEQQQTQPANIEQPYDTTAVTSAAPGTAPPTEEPTEASVTTALPMPVAAPVPEVVSAPPAPDGPSSLWATVSIQPSVNATGFTPFSSSYIAAELPAAAAAATYTSSGIQMPNNPYPGRLGICGNGVCEIGERSTVGAIEGACPQDCGLPAVACIGGCGIGGNCLPSTGVCQCYVGYQGTNCADCAPGFMSNGGVCVTSVTSLQLVDASVLGPNGEALVSGVASKSNTGLIVGIVVGSLAGFAVLVFVFMMLRKCLKRRYDAGEAAKAAYGGGKDDFNKPYGAVGGGASGGVDEEIGLRQRYGIPTSARSGDGGFGSARSYTVHVDGTGAIAGGDTCGQVSARSGDGWQSARESSRSGHGYQVDAAAFPQLHSQSLHFQGVSGFSAGASTSAGPMAQNAMERRSTFSLPAEAEMRASFPPAQQQGGVYYPGSGRSMSAPAADAVAAAAPPLPSHRDRDVRASMQSISESQSHSSAVSLALSSVDLSSSSGGAPGTTAVAAGGNNNALNQAASRLFFNPAFSVEGKSGVDVHTSIAPGYIAKTRSLSARGPAGSVTAAGSAATTTAAPMSARPYSARLNEESVQDRRAKLDALRAAVKALEQQAAAKGGPPMPPHATADFSSSEQQQHQQENIFLPGRPTVPRLSLATLNAPPQQRPRRPGRPVVRQESLPESELIKSHPGPPQTMLIAPAAVPQVAAVPKRSSPGAALARGAKSIFMELTSFKSGSPKPAAEAAKPLSGQGSGLVYSSGGYTAVMAKVEGALQRSAGNSPVKQPAGQGKGSARGTTGPSAGPGPSRIPSAPAAAWR